MSLEVMQCGICDFFNDLFINNQKNKSDNYHNYSKKIKKKNKKKTKSIYKKYINDKSCSVCNIPINNKSKIYYFNSCNHIVHKKCINHNDYYYIFDNKCLNKYLHTSDKIYLKCPICK